MNEENEYYLKCLTAATKAMREKQKQFFRTRDQRVLRECKRLEEQVDKLLAEK